MVFAGILAGGSGTRMENATMPKQFMRVGGVPIFIRTLKTFLSCSKIDMAVVSVNVDWEKKYYELIDEFKLDSERICLTPGGSTRFESLINIVKCAGEIDADSVIITHDCARMFVSCEIIERNLQAAEKYKMVTTSVPVIDTVLESSDGQTITGAPDRSKLINDQGPQTFNIHTFLEYIKDIPEDKLSEYIEAGKLYIEHGDKVGFVAGNRYNFKVTNEFDLKYAEFLIKNEMV